MSQDSVYITSPKLPAAPSTRLPMCGLSKALIGEPAPSFDCRAIVDGRIKSISLETYTDAYHWLVLIFFPKAWSFICPTEIRSFSARLEEFLYSRSCAVVFASTDSEFCLRAWNSTSELEGGLGGVHVPLISDSSHCLSRDYGVLDEKEGTAQRALFIIDPKGTLRAMSVNDVDVGRSVDEVIRILDALAFKDEFGEGCPVNWKKGDRGIDIVTRSRVEGPVEVESRKTWSEWARPKLQRAWSGTSQRSTTNIMRLVSNTSGGRVPSNEGSSLPTLGGITSTPDTTKISMQTRPQSVFLTPTSSTNSASKHDVETEDAIAAIKLGQCITNERAMMTNQAVGAAL